MHHHGIGVKGQQTCLETFQAGEDDLGSIFSLLLINISSIIILKLIKLVLTKDY